jgi:hypothetical protein
VYGEADTSNFPEPADDDTDTISLESSTPNIQTSIETSCLLWALLWPLASAKPKKQEVGFDKMPVASGSRPSHIVRFVKNFIWLELVYISIIFCLNLMKKTIKID